MKLIPTLIRTAALTVILASAASAQAGLVNGRFTAGLTGWQTVGDTSVQAPFNTLGLPMESARALVLTTASLFDDDVSGQNGAFNLSGHSAVDIYSELAPFAHAAPEQLELDPVDHTVPSIEGSAARQTTLVKAGDTLSFNWNLFSRDRDMPDTAWLVIAPVSGPNEVITLGSSLQASSALPDGADALQQTGWQSFSYTFQNTGHVTLTWAIADVNDWGQTSMLALNTIEVTTPVPEPSTALLALASLGATAFMRRKTRQNGSE